MGEIIEHAGEHLPAASQSTSLLSQVLEAARDKSVDPANIRAMIELAEHMQDRERQAEFSRDKVAAINEMPQIFKDAVNGGTKSRYATFERLHMRVRPVLDRHNLSLSFILGQSGNMITVEAVLEHRNGVKERGGPLSLPADTGPGRNSVQAHVSTVAYGKRATAKAILNILEGGEDDDGAGGGSTDPYEQLSPDERQLVDQGRQVAADGIPAYEAWYKALGPQQRGFLAFNRAGPNGMTWHDQNKDLAVKV